MPRPKNRKPFAWSIPIGRVAGIPISVHVTFFLLVALVAIDNTGPGGLGWLGATIWILLLFGCVTVHELGHSLLARRKGAHVLSIVLLPLGGVSRIERMPENWRDELWVALVGPLTSIALGALAAAGAIAVHLPLLPINIVSGPLLPRLAWANLMLGVFNLVPAFPLDGGRVLRAGLERRHDIETSTHLAARIGRAFAVVLAVIGLFWDIWLVLIAAFVYLAATQEELSTTIHVRLTGCPVRQLMRSPVHTLDAERRLGSLTTSLSGIQVVSSAGRYVGLADGRALMTGDADALVGDVTDRSAPTLDPDEDLGRSGLDTLAGSGYPLLAVVDDGTAVGALLLEDIARWYGPSGLAGRAART